MRVRAAVLRQMGLPRPYVDSQPLQIEELELSPPGRDELLVRMLAAGLCHSDLSVINGSRPRVLPMALGHEACGEVVEVGSDTTGWTVGDRAVFSFVPNCGACQPCLTGRAALCEPGARANLAGTLLGGAAHWSTRHGGQQGETIHHHLGVSAFAEYAVVSVRSAVRVPVDLDPAIAALFGCAVLTGVGAVVNTARVAAGESVAVIGLGGVGQAALLGARASGAYPIVAVDSLAEKAAAALALGAHFAVTADLNHPEQTVEQIRELSQGGVVSSIECVGSEAALAQAYAVTRRGGITVTTGLPDPKQRFSVPAVSLVAEERTVKGSYMGSCVPSRDIPRFVAMYRAGLLPVDALLSQRLRLEQINAGFDKLACGEGARQVVVYG